jgi:hypothetical protein
MQGDFKFIIYAPRYDEQSGGAIVLHKLCDSLNELGYEASLWPFDKPRFIWRRVHYYLIKLFLYYSIRFFRSSVLNSRDLHAPFATSSDIDNSIVIYPEVIHGNPLEAPRYVRWLLHKPGFHTGLIGKRDRELYFYFLEAFNDHIPGAICGGKLTVLDYFKDLYKIENHGVRSKVGYIIRKGINREDLPNLNDHWILDGLDHSKMAKAFNECVKCYFYDPYTLYSTYAALCGCVPVIVPLPGIAKEQWFPEEDLRYGIAYGEDDIPYAIATRVKLIDRLEKDEESNGKTIHQFAGTVKFFFDNSASF